MLANGIHQRSGVGGRRERRGLMLVLRDLLTGPVSVGLRNRGATCYINSLIQQLYAVDAVRDSLLGTELPTPEELAGDADDPDGKRLQRSTRLLEVVGRLQEVFVFLRRDACIQWMQYMGRSCWMSCRCMSSVGLTSGSRCVT